MKTITISQPYASLIASGEKWVENRVWETLYRGPLLIHAGKGVQYLSRKELAEYPTSCIVAVAQLSACVHISAIERARTFPHRWKIPIKGTNRFWSELDRHEHAEGPFCWILEHVVALETPQSVARGLQRLWNFDEPAETALAEAVVKSGELKAES